MKASQIAAVAVAVAAAVVAWNAQKPQPPVPEEGSWEPTADLGAGR